MPQQIKMEPSWLAHLEGEFQQPYMQQLRDFLLSEKAAKKQIFPHSNNIFRAFELTPIDQVKVVILGQDPYHNIGQAHGLCFSVQPDIQIPPSLVNIYKELQDDIGMPIPQTGFLESWAKQGVLLLNSVLTVEAHQAASHQGKGWERFTDKIIHLLNEQHEHIVFMLWGSYAQKKGAFIDTQKHLVLKAPHPSPLSAYRGFFGCKHFSQANAYLVEHGCEPIDWNIVQ